jgi:hypothetical protein
VYGEIPTILQGAATRETLTPEQLSRLQSQGVSTEGAGVNVSSVLPMLIVGAIAAWFLAGGTKRRSLWILLLALTSPLSAQSFTQQVVTGPDTSTVYGHYVTVTQTTVTVDSVIPKKPTPPPVVLGFPYGPIRLFDASASPPFNGTGGISSGSPQSLLDNITKARQRKIPFIANLPCGGHNAVNLGNCLALVNGVPTFSQLRFNDALERYNTASVRAAVQAAVKDSILIGINLMDEPWVTGGGDGNTWGPAGTMTRQRVDSLCRRARNVFGPGVPLGASDQTKWQRTGKWDACDIGIAQFSYRYGSVKAWRDSILAVSSAQGYQSIFSTNFINGGTQDRTGPWDCPGGHKGQRAPNCQQTPAQHIGAIDTLGDKGCGVVTMWRYDAARFALPGYATAFATAAALQAQRKRKVCGVR